MNESSGEYKDALLAALKFIRAKLDDTMQATRSAR